MAPARLNVHTLIDCVLFLFIYPAGLLLKYVRRTGVDKLPACKRVLDKIGVFPIRNHYYEPKFIYEPDELAGNRVRNLPGIDWRAKEQINFLSNLTFSAELATVAMAKAGTLEFHFNNGFFESGDMEYWYQLIRYLKPSRIIEIGSGFSTLAAIDAIKENKEQQPAYECQHLCIEPFEKPWLEDSGVEIFREKIEDMDIGLFSELEANDILFIDSSHVIRPHGDVLTEYLEILPILNKGVIVHIHDIFSPRDYPDDWLENRVIFWNEQYLLEAFLTQNSSWEILGSLNYLFHMHYESLKSVAPYLTPDREPGSIYIRKIK